jgi:virulence-associated protein VapD
MLIRSVLQQATDHYPRLAALGFTVQQGTTYSCDNVRHDSAQLLRFHAETTTCIRQFHLLFFQQMGWRSISEVHHTFSTETYPC